MQECIIIEMPTGYTTFLMMAYENNKKYYAAVVISRQKIDKSQYQKQDFC